MQHTTEQLRKMLADQQDATYRALSVIKSSITALESNIARTNELLDAADKAPITDLSWVLHSWLGVLRRDKVKLYLHHYAGQNILALELSELGPGGTTIWEVSTGMNAALVSDIVNDSYSELDKTSKSGLVLHPVPIDLVNMAFSVLRLLKSEKIHFICTALSMGFHVSVSGYRYAFYTDQQGEWLQTFNILKDRIANGN